MNRIIEDEGVILFYAPYYRGQNEFASARVDCDVGDLALNELLDYYQTSQVFTLFKNDKPLKPL